MKRLSSQWDAPRLADSLGALECKVRQVIEVGDHTFFIGAVTHKVLRPDAPRLHHIDISLQEMITAERANDATTTSGRSRPAEGSTLQS